MKSFRRIFNLLQEHCPQAKHWILDGSLHKRCAQASFADQARTYIPWHLHTQTTSIPQQGTVFCSTSFYCRNVRNSPLNKTKSSRRLPGLKVPQILIWLSYLGRAWKNASHESLLAWGEWGGWFIWDIFGWVLSGKKNSSTVTCFVHVIHHVIHPLFKRLKMLNISL